jgi:predicted nucleotidyltransferase
MIEQLSLTTNERNALEQFVQQLHRRFGERVQSVTLFGSKARGDFPGCDIDLLGRLADWADG